MEYESLDPKVATILFIIYITLALLIWILCIFLWIHWNRRKRRTVLYLAFAFIFYAVAILVIAIGMYEVVKTGNRMEIYIISLPIGLIGIMIGHIFAILFASSIFEIQIKKVRVYIIIDFLISLALMHPNNNYGLLEGQLRLPNIRIYTSVMMVIFVIFVFTRIAFIAFKAKNQIEDKYTKIGFICLGWAQVFMILFYFNYTIDSICVYYFDMEEFTPFFYIAMFFLYFCIIMFYLAIILPVWILNKNISEYFEELYKIRRPKVVYPHQFFQVKKRINIQCPICDKEIIYDIPPHFLKMIKNSKSGVINVSIRKNLICPHQFVIIIDNNCDIRGYEEMDFIPKESQNQKT